MSMTYPPPDTACFQVYSTGIRPVLFQRCLPLGRASILISTGFPTRDPATGVVSTTWSLVPRQAPLGDLFADRDAALAELRRRGGTASNKAQAARRASA